MSRSCDEPSAVAKKPTSSDMGSLSSSSTDGFGVTDATPDTRAVTVNATSGGAVDEDDGGGSGGGGCFIETAAYESGMAR